MKKGLCLLFFSFFVVLLGSCASSKVSGSGDLCGMIVDENNNPVSNYVVKCLKNKLICGAALTNESGIFVISDLPYDDYIITGEKSGWAKIINQPYHFDSIDNILCCKVNSMKSAIEAAEKNIELEEYDEAVRLLDEIFVLKGTVDEATVGYFAAYANILAGDLVKAMKYIEILKNNKFSADSGVTEQLELMLLGDDEEFD